MGKIKYNVRGVEASGFDTPPPGIYVCKLVECNEKESKAGNEMLECIYEIARGDHKGSKLWDYVVQTEEAAWKMRQFLEAIGLVKGKKEKGVLDTDKVLGTEVQVKVKHETYNDEARARVASVLPMPEVEDDEGLDDEEEVGDDDDEGAGEDLTWEDLEEMDLGDLKEIIDEEDLEIRVTKKSNVDKVREKVADALEIEQEEEDDEEDDEEEEEDYDDMSVPDLKAELKERGLKTSGSKKVLIKRLEKDDEENDDDPF